MSCLALASCSTPVIPTSGPTRSEVVDGANRSGATDAQSLGAIQFIDLTDDVVQALRGQERQQLFSQSLGDRPAPPLNVGVGDSLEVTVWEAPPATLFGSAMLDAKSAGGVTTSHSATIPELVVNRSGEINVPFVGRLKVAGRSLQDIENDITTRLTGKANRPQVQVRIARNVATSVTVVGEVVNSMRVPLTPRGERLLDALASAGGVRHPVDKVSVQITRGQQVHTLSLDTIIRDPRQNVSLQPGDVITVLHQPLSFMALGAVTKNEEIAFEGKGINLTQALARIGGLQDQRADAQGVFVFRLEDKAALNWPRQPVQANADGKVAVIYRVNLRDPRSFFVAQNFPVHNNDLVYVSNAPVADLQKFVNVIAGIGFPVLGVYNALR